jgi:hypothetical protein
MTSKSPLKRTIIAQGIEGYKLNKSIRTTYVPKAGDLAIFKVLEIGKHDSIQGVNGNNTYIFPGDHILAAFGNRYATEQFEGYVPMEFQKEYHILGKGGAIGILASTHEKFDAVGPTTLRLVGYATDDAGNVINTKYHHKPKVQFDTTKLRQQKIILSLGASMDSGKTTSAAYTCRGLRAAGHSVAFIKLTGTVYTKDIHFARDCGAQLSTDFSKLGFPSTYMCSIEELLDLYEGLLAIASAIKPDYVVVEIADGIFQRETEMLLRCKPFMDTVSHVIFSAPESLSALNGIRLLKEYGIKPFAVSGLFTTSPLLREEVATRTDVPVKHISEIGTTAILELLSPFHQHNGHEAHDQDESHTKHGSFKRMTVASAG